MIGILKALALTASLLLIQGLVITSEYEFGTKVLAQDSDIGRALYAFPSADIRYWDIGPNPNIYDEGDVLYLAKNTPFTVVTANDIRITPFGYYPAGSKVKAGDEDMDMPLTAFPAGHAIVYLDLYGSTAFDLDDPVYFHQNALPFIVTNDVRLTYTCGNAPGTMVIDFNPDHFKPFALLQALPYAPGLPGALINYFDVNGNGIYDYPDDVYLIHPAGAPLLDPHIRVNSLRFSGPAC
jgi:hypothetical protein